MNKMIRSIIALSASILAFASLNSCKVHEWPDPTTPADVVLSLDFDTEMPQYQVLDKMGTRASRDGRDYILRYTVEAYRALPDGKFADQPYVRHTFTKEETYDLNNTVQFSIAEGTYLFYVWTDFIVKGTTEDFFYSTKNFRRIELIGTHEGNNDYRDAFCGNAELSVIRKGTNEQPSTVTVQMGRPLAKFEFVTTDLQEFITKTIAMMLQKEAESAEYEEDTKSDSETKAPMVDLQKFKVMFIYSGYMPYAFNMIDNKPCDSKTGVTFNSTITAIDSHDASLGFDYVFVNGKESSVMVTIALFDENDTQLSISPQVEVPIKRSMLTTVRGSYLMQNTGGGVAIDPGFQDEFNIYIP